MAGLTLFISPFAPSAFGSMDFHLVSPREFKVNPATSNKEPCNSHSRNYQGSDFFKEAFMTLSWDFRLFCRAFASSEVRSAMSSFS